MQRTVHTIPSRLVWGQDHEQKMSVWYIGFAMGTPGSPFPRVLMRFSFLIPRGARIWIPQNSSSSSDVPGGPRGTKSSLIYVGVEHFCAHKIQFKCKIL
jgi:hypothetical protein